MLIDTSALIEMLKRGKFIQGAISIVTLLEVLRGIQEKRRREIKQLLEQCFEVISLNNEIIEKYCELYNKLKQRGELIPDADILITATALVTRMKLVTKDKHFLRLRQFGFEVEVLK